uniref:Uncharacterized protein n=1 Tax=Eucampia antarctica TaxID=49252 RepID=A0A7S2R2D6_9STRA|mmetsp:Transcript_14217/g.13725  ORF Transcript_14217/g.13725 Transcript_14217/m.13725 type:complete len:110 (+) Transcript_14217:64-393(+)|eukprot:CAMPEP_0197827642 /NCGR_PEP_ID=MMETSP1437-20131217/4381_1 /TAXON_ID=49252 ORGANISM="Eucampia antarctica, Strain CCMP1452" /NCGR_SAMPLE_ID=MMETSP1437 /ASSEMBLY_ACC=CAM_ASM_001096 /LENGTH=109 /DNA_ID=CAMNT_0043428575 /DNA_START=56 /DNA_END=385 /DNA_ORIENTATION=+
MADAKYQEVSVYFQSRMAESKKIWATRGSDARAITLAERAKGPVTWRQMKGVQLMIHEIRHIGNRPFAWGFFTIAVASTFMQLKFTDEARAGSEYWSNFHGAEKKSGEN